MLCGDVLPSNSATEYRREINLNFGDGIGITPEGNFRVNKSITYNPKYYTLISSNQTQQGVINLLQAKEKVTQREKQPSRDLDKELKILTTIDLLKRKIKTLNNHTEKLEDYTRYKDTDNIILTKRRLEKAKSIVIRYLETLKQDNNFKFVRVGETCFKLSYLGTYVRATSRGNLLIKGVC